MSKYLVNSPAGSGKTTTIERMVKNKIGNLSRNESILCITYTNRAAEELMTKLDSEKVDISTIHSFLANMFSRFFKLDEVKKLYFEVYEENIKNSILNSKEDRDSRYKERFNVDDITFSIIKSNIDKLRYSETQFSSFYYGTLSHDDLLVFCNKMIMRFPKMRRILANKYTTIYIDEYQDTSGVVLEIFNLIADENNCDLYLFGDLMQQIYDNYSGEMENVLSTYSREIVLDTNYRSTKNIVNLLNNIYNDEELVQVSNSDIEGVMPKVIIGQSELPELGLYEKYLKLVLLNRNRFNEIGVLDLFNAYTRHDDYKHGSKYTATDVLTTSHNDNPDILMKLMMKIELAVNLVSDGDVGSGLKLLSTALKKNVNQFFLEKNSDKKILKQHIKSFVDLFKSESSTIDELFTLLKEIRILSDYDYDILLERYQIIFQLNLHQIVKLNNFLKRPDYSTQHGVKGEGHKKVLFICGATNSTPFIDMYSFLDFWADNNLNLRKIQSLYYNYSNFVKEILSTLKVSLSRIKTDLYNEHISFIEKSVVKYKSFLDDEIFSKLYGDAYERYMLSKTKTNFVNMIKPKKLRNIVMSFKLFYVGCSRAKEELIIYIDESKLQNKSAVFQKMKSLGFDLNN